MDIKVEADLLKDGDAWHIEWHTKRNAAVAALVAAGRGTLPEDAPRDDVNDVLAAGVFWRRERRSRSDEMASDEAMLYEAVVQAIQLARDDERKRFSKALGRGLKAMLGDDYTAVMYDLAQEDDINIGYSW
jgi:hypothetical protein